jgi:hypothetical protein
MRTIAAAALALVLVSATGCATSVRSIPDDFATAPDERSIVIGRVELVWAQTGAGLWNAPHPALAFLRADRLQIKAKNERTGRTFYIGALDMGPASDFNVPLPYGQYRIDEIGTQQMRSPVKALFEVPRAAAVYVGTFRFSGYQPPFAQRLLTLSFARGQWSIVDGSDEAIPRFRARHPQLTQAVVSSLATVGGAGTPQARSSD